MLWNAFLKLLFSRVPSGLEDVSKYVELVSALYASGSWQVDDLKKLVGLNFIRVFREVEKVIIQLSHSCRFKGTMLQKINFDTE